MTTTQPGGQRIGGQTYMPGQMLPERYRRVLEPSDRPRDPAVRDPDLAPNLGRHTVPHIITFQGLVTSLARAYRNPDEAFRHSVENAHMMLTDPTVSGPLHARQMMTALLQWSVESEDDKDSQLKEAASQLQKVLERTPRFAELRRWLLEAIWYGRAASQHAIGFHRDRFGVRRRVIKKWLPISGDKLLFRYDDGSGEFDPDQIGVRVSPGLGREDIIAGRRKLEATTDGMGYFLEPWERRHWAVHKHMIRDGEFEDPLSAGQVHGVGLRHFLYWVWYQKQEAMAQLAEVLDRTGAGITIYYYPVGNQEAKTQVEKVAREQAHTNVLVMPFDPASTGGDPYSIQQIPPNVAGLQALQDIVDGYFGDMITRAILGQTLSSKPSAAGMNTGVSDLQKDSLFHIVRYDAVNLQETITREILLPLRDFNLPKFRNVDFFFKISTKVSAPQEELAAIYQAWQMGTKIRVQDLFQKLDMAMPDKDDKVVFNPQIVSAIQQVESAPMGGLAPPGGAGPQPPGATPFPPGAAEGTPTSEGGGQNEPPPIDRGGASGQPEQLDKAESPEQERRKLFGPILYGKREEYLERIREAVENTEPNPTEAQREAGNYRKGVVHWRGLEVVIETPKGQRRRPEWPALRAHYGYIRRHYHTGEQRLVTSEPCADGDHLDIFLGPQPESDIVFVIDQVTADGKFDEHKCILGTTNKRDARALYLSNYADGWKCGPIRGMTIETFKHWLEHGDLTKPVARQKLRYARQLSLFDDTFSLVRKPRSLFDEGSHPRAKEHVEIQGKEYEGGQWIPKDAAVEATPAAQEKIEVVDKSTGETEPLEQTLKPGDNATASPPSPEDDSHDQPRSDAEFAPGEPDSTGGDGDRGRPDDGESGGAGDLGANPVGPSEERIVTSRQQHTRPADRSLVPERLRQHLDDHQQEGVAKAIASLRDVGGFLNSDGTGVGKAQPLDEPILTPTGWKRMGDLQIGDEVISADGFPTKISGVYPQGHLEVYRVTFSDGSWTECCAEHLWQTHTWSDRRNLSRGLRRQGNVRSLREIASSLVANGGQSNHSIPMTAPVAFQPRQILLDPYVLGVLLGDGGMSRQASLTVTSVDQEILDSVGHTLPTGVRLRRIGNSPSYSITTDRRATKSGNPMVTELRRLGLHGPGKTSDTKFIPEDYKFNSVDVRLSVLQGLMDTDGTIDKRGTSCVYTTTSRKLADDIVFLVQSLGGTARIQSKQPTYCYNGDKRDGKQAYNVTLCLPPEFKPFRLSRKSGRVVPKSKYAPRRYIKTVEQIGSKPCQCIAVENKSHLYLTRGFIVTHNTRQLLATAQHYLDQGKKVIVIAPKGVTKADWKKKTVTGSWQNDSQAMGVPIHVTRDEIDPKAVNISSYENLAKLKRQVDDNTIVMFDEAHSLKNRDSARSKHGVEMANTAAAVLFATATPVDKVEHLHYLDRAGAFGGRYYGQTYEQLGLEQVEQSIGGGQTVKKWQIRPGVKASEVMRRLSGLFTRLTADGRMVKREISMKDVPVSVRQVKLPPEAHEVLDRIEEELTGTSANEGLERARILMHQRRQQEPYKVAPAVDEALQALDAGRQVVIFASRVNESQVGGEDDDDENAIKSEGTMKLLREELERRGIKPADIAEIHGGVSKTKIPKEMDRFQAGQARVVIATVESGGTGINLDDTRGDRPRTLIMMTAPFSAVENVQAAGRVWRLKTKSIPEIKYLFGDTEVDDWNSALISKKMRTLGASVSGQIGKLDVNNLNESDAIDFESEEPYEWQYPGEGEPPSASFTKLDSGEWGMRVDGRVRPGETVEIAKRDGSKTRRVVGKIVKAGAGFTIATLSDAAPAREQLPPPPPPPPSPPPPKAPTAKPSHPFEALAAWSQPKKVNTAQGPRMVRSARPTDKFWKEWGKDKERLKRQGISVSKYQGEWQISWWQEAPDRNAKRYAKDILPGGLADDAPPVDAAALARGIAIEMEHTDDPAIAKEIAADHLAEFPDYYDALEQMEASLRSRASKLGDRLRYAKDLADLSAEPLTYACACRQRYAKGDESSHDHELGHVSDLEFGQVSETPAWREAWQQELASGELNEESSENPAEGLAEYVALVLQSPKQARDEYPVCWESLEMAGMIEDVASDGPARYAYDESQHPRDDDGMVQEYSKLTG